MRKLLLAGWLTSQPNRVFCVGKTIDSDRTICENVDDFFLLPLYCAVSLRCLVVWSFSRPFSCIYTRLRLNCSGENRYMSA